MYRKPFALFALVLAAACAGPQAPQANNLPGSIKPDIVAEARAFMKDMADEMMRGESGSLASRYHPNGVKTFAKGVQGFKSWEEIQERFRHWRPSTRVTWDNLVFEPTGPDSILVAGRLRTREHGARNSYSLIMLLKRRDGELRIHFISQDYLGGHCC